MSKQKTSSKSLPLFLLTFLLLGATCAQNQTNSAAPPHETLPQFQQRMQQKWKGKIQKKFLQAKDQFYQTDNGAVHEKHMIQCKQAAKKKEQPPQNGCLICHKNHQDYLQLQQPIPKLCFQCHSKSNYIPQKRFEDLSL